MNEYVASDMGRRGAQPGSERGRHCRTSKFPLGTSGG